MSFVLQFWWTPRSVIWIVKLRNTAAQETLEQCLGEDFRRCWKQSTFDGRLRNVLLGNSLFNSNPILSFNGLANSQHPRKTNRTSFSKSYCDCPGISLSKIHSGPSDRSK